MGELLDTDTQNPLVELVETYISQKRSGQKFDSQHYCDVLKEMNFSDDQVHDLLIEMEDDADKELLAGIGVQKAKNRLILGVSVGLIGIILCFTAAFVSYHGISLRFFFLPFGIVGAAFLVAGKAYMEIGAVKKRKKRRFLKYKNWN